MFRIRQFVRWKHKTTGKNACSFASFSYGHIYKYIDLARRRFECSIDYAKIWVVGISEELRTRGHIQTKKGKKRNTGQRKSRRGRKTYARTFLRHIDPSAGSFFQQFRREIDVFSLSLCYIGLFVHVRMPTDTKCKPPYISQTEMCAVLSWKDENWREREWEGKILQTHITNRLDSENDFNTMSKSKNMEEIPMQWIRLVRSFCFFVCYFAYAIRVCVSGSHWERASERLSECVKRVYRTCLYFNLIENDETGT